MASDNQNPMTSPQQQPTRGPGPALRAKREAGGYSLDEVSKDTRITRTKLAALEAEEYAKAGSDTFVMGYIRQYAKWLGMDGDELVRDYERAVGRKRNEVPEPLTETGPTYTSTHKGFPLVWLVVVVVVIWLAATWFLNGRQQPEPPEAPQPTADLQGQAPEVDAEPADGAGDMQEDPFSVDEVPSEESPDVAEEETLAPADTLSGGLGTGEAPGSEPVEAAEDIPSADEAPAPEPAATDELTMTFSGDCWVEVRNAAGEVLFAQLQHAGDNLHLSGQAPFNIMLGNARAATVFVNGRLVNSDPGPNRDTMRLRSVGP